MSAAELRSSMFIGGYPWYDPADATPATTSAEICRGFVVMPFGESPVFCDDSKDPLPCVAQWVDSQRRRWRKYELPRGESDESRSRISLSDDPIAGNASAMIPLGKGISRSWLDEQLDSEEQLGGEEQPTTGSLGQYARIRDQLDTHAEFINDLSDQIRPHRYYWEGNCEGVFIRSVHRVTSRWVRSDEREQARLSLIVKLAREITRTLAQVCEQPRVVLRRTREFQKISKIQEVDPACLRWLARQPGRDVYERAGPRQQLLGVVRRESTDTLENRVVRDFLHRARVECASYLSVHRDYPNHHRVRAVSGFRRQLIHWEKQSDIRNAKRLLGHVQPNYVLLHESKYRRIWEAYQLLLSQQKLKDDIWKWRDRTFSENCGFGLLSLLRKYSGRSTFSKSDIALQTEAVTGSFLSPQTQLGPARLQSRSGSCEVFFCPGAQAPQCPFVSREFYPLSADFFLGVPAKRSAERLIPVWCLLHPEEGDTRRALSVLEKKLLRFPNSDRIYPLVFVYSRPDLCGEFLGGRGLLASIDYPIAKSISAAEPFLLTSLGA